MAQLPEHVRFALPRCQPEQLSGVAATIQPSQGKERLLLASQTRLWDLWDHKNTVVRVQVMVFPSPFLNSTMNYCNSFLLRQQCPFFPQHSRAQLGLSHGSLPCLLQGTRVLLTVQNQLPMVFPKGTSAADALVITGDTTGPSLGAAEALLLHIPVTLWSYPSSLPVRLNSMDRAFF